MVVMVIGVRVFVGDCFGATPAGLHGSCVNQPMHIDRTHSQPHDAVFCASVRFSPSIRSETTLSLHFWTVIA